MPLVIRDVEHADITECIGLRVAALGSLVIGRLPPYLGYVDEAEARVRRELDGSPHVHHLKVVDTEKGEEIVAYGKWEVYERGRGEDVGSASVGGGEGEGFRELRRLVRGWFHKRKKEMGKKPHICEW